MPNPIGEIIAKKEDAADALMIERLKNKKQLLRKAKIAAVQYGDHEMESVCSEEILKCHNQIQKLMGGL